MDGIEFQRECRARELYLVLFNDLVNFSKDLKSVNICMHVLGIHVMTEWN